MISRLNHDVVAGALLILLAAFLLVETLNIPTDGAMWPRVVLVLLAVLAVSIVARGIRKTRTGAEIQEGEGEKLTLRLLVSPLIVVGLTVTYIVLVSVVGFFPATVAFLAAYLFYGRVRDWKINVVVVGGVTLFLYLLFVMQLNVQLPPGILFS